MSVSYLYLEIVVNSRNTCVNLQNRVILGASNLKTYFLKYKKALIKIPEKTPID